MRNTRKLRSGTSCGEQVLKFDLCKRKEYITGFRKRKVQRKKRGMEQKLEQERQERIDVKRDHREDIKNNWKQLRWAERKIEQKFADAKDLKDHDSEEADGEQDVPAADTSVTVSFDREEDDPFGDCEVTTTDVNETGGVAAVKLEEGSKLWLAVMAGPNAAQWQSAWAANPLRAAEEEWRRRRRAISVRKEEDVRKHSLAKKVEKRLADKTGKKTKKKKNKAKDKGAGKRKVGAKARRRRK